LDPLVGHTNLGSELPERIEVEIDRPGTDRVPSHQGNEDLAQAMEERTDHQDRNPVEARVTNGDPSVAELDRINGHGRSLDRHTGADRSEDVRGDLDVANPRGFSSHVRGLPRRGGTINLVKAV